jgi:hypothetical protein
MRAFTNDEKLTFRSPSGAAEDPGIDVNQSNMPESNESGK